MMTSYSPLLLLCFLLCGSLQTEAIHKTYVPSNHQYHHQHKENSHRRVPVVIRREERRPLVATEYGQITAVEINAFGTSTKSGPYDLHFFTMEPNSLLLPVQIHAHMVLYVHTGSGKLRWTSEGGEEMKRVDLRRGDVFSLHSGSVFFLQSNLDQERQKLRIYAIFSSPHGNIFEPSVGAYSSVRDLVVGFDKRILKSAFKADEGVLEEITSAMKQQAIVHAVQIPEKKSAFWELLKSLMDGTSYGVINGKHGKENRAFNVLEAHRDFENSNGWSLTVDKRDLTSLKESDIGMFMVNLTEGSMVGPHWNPRAMEIGIVLHGQGMVRVVCPSNVNETECRNLRFRVTEGDIFVVPRFHPMAQMSFNNDTFVFFGFSSSHKRNHPQFLAGKRSVLQTLDRDILAMSFNVTNTTMHRALASQEESIILECTSCAEEEERFMEREREEEEERKREEEERKQEEEAAKKREEEERKREEQEATEREEEEEEEEERRQAEAAAQRKREEQERERERERREAEEEAAERERERQRRREERREAEATTEEEEARKQEEERQRRWTEEEAARKERERQEEEARTRRGREPEPEILVTIQILE